VHIENQVATQQQNQIVQLQNLAGKIYKARLLSPRRFYGLFSGAAAVYGYNYYAFLAHAYNPTFVTVAIGVLGLHFMTCFKQANFVKEMDWDFESGKVNITVGVTALQSRTIKTSIAAIHQVGVHRMNGQLDDVDNLVI